MFGVLLTLEWLTYYAIASDLIVLPGQGGLVIVTVQVPRSPRNEEKCHYLEEKRCDVSSYPGYSESSVQGRKIRNPNYKSNKPGPSCPFYHKKYPENWRAAQARRDRPTGVLDHVPRKRLHFCSPIT